MQLPYFENIIVQYSNLNNKKDIKSLLIQIFLIIITRKKKGVKNSVSPAKSPNCETSFWSLKEKIFQYQNFERYVALFIWYTCLKNIVSRLRHLYVTE